MYTQLGNRSSTSGNFLFGAERPNRQSVVEPDGKNLCARSENASETERHSTFRRCKSLVGRQTRQERKGQAADNDEMPNETMETRQEDRREGTKREGGILEFFQTITNVIGDGLRTHQERTMLTI